MITTLNPKFDLYLIYLSLIFLAYFAFFNILSVATFLAGFAVSFPIAFRAWEAIERNWKTLYKKFYTQNFYERDGRLIARSVKLTWWLVPWCLAVYSTVSFAIIRFSEDFTLLFSFVFGSLFAIGWISRQKSPKYYKEVQKWTKRKR